MTTETQTQQSTTTAGTGNNQVTLDDVYASVDFSKLETGTQQQTTQQQAPPQQQPRQEEVHVPDPYDQEGVKNWMTEQARRSSALSTSLQQVLGTLTAQQQATQIQRLEEDIGKAVNKVNEIVGLPDENKQMLRYALDAKVDADPKFKQLWNNRHSNPIAWERAQVAVAQEFAKTFSVKVDPQIAADRRALRVSQSQSATTSNTQEQHPLEAAQGADFDRMWEQLRRG